MRCLFCAVMRRAVLNGDVLCHAAKLCCAFVCCVVLGCVVLCLPSLLARFSPSSFPVSDKPGLIFVGSTGGRNRLHGLDVVIQFKQTTGQAAHLG